MAKGEEQARVREILDRLEAHYPEAECALRHDDPLQLLVATILSAQCTDRRVNLVTPGLFRKYPDAAAFAQASLRDLEAAIRTTGFYRNKARNIRECCRRLDREFGGEVPPRLEDLVTLPGVGRKTANVVLGSAFGIPGITVDTHVGRVSRRLRLTRHEDPVKVEYDLMKILPRERWSIFSHQMIWHGRRICGARRPLCPDCFLKELCPFPARASRTSGKRPPTSVGAAHAGRKTRTARPRAV